MQIWKFANISSSLYENHMSKISHKNTFYFLRYADVRYVKFIYKHPETIEYAKN